jgi:cation diffusion facilitator CzcD-associated flavoprotein CzcO
MTPFPGNYVCINTDIPSVEDNHLPYFPFPDSWPVFIPKDDMADWLKTYAKTMKLDVWTSTYLQETSWKGSHWQLVLVKLLDDGVSEKITLRPRHIIQATGQAGKPHIPRVSGISTFRGSVCHSAHFAGASPCKAAQHAVIVGSGNSAHDIARNYYDQGWKVTMIQRSSTFVDPVQYNSCKGLYREGGLPTEDADLLTQSIPNALLKRVQMEAVSQTRLEHHALFTRLEEQGFKLNWGPEGSG